MVENAPKAAHQVGIKDQILGAASIISKSTNAGKSVMPPPIQLFPTGIEQSAEEELSESKDEQKDQRTFQFKDTSQAAPPETPNSPINRINFGSAFNTPGQSNPIKPFQLKQIPPSSTITQRTSSMKKPPKVGGAFKASEQGIEVSISVTPEKKVKARYAKITYSSPITAKGELKLKGDAPDEGASREQDTDNSTTVKGRLNLYKATAIKEGTNSLSEAAYNKLAEGGMFDIKSADLEYGTTLSDENLNPSTSPMVGIKFTLENGDELTTSINLFTYSKDDKSGPSLNAAYQFSLPPYIAWQNNFAELNIGGDIKAQIKIEPNYAKIFKDLLKAKARKMILARMSRLLFGPGAIIAGIGVTIFAAWKMIDSIQSIKNTAQSAQNAKGSYVSGFLDELGISKFGKNKKDFDFFLNGCADGNAAIAKQVTIIQSHPYFAEWNFSRGELFEGIRQECAKHPGIFYKEIEGRARATIYPKFVNDYYKKRKSEWTTSEYMAFKDAKHVATRLGYTESVINREK